MVALVAVAKSAHTAVGRVADVRFGEGRFGFGVASPEHEATEARFSNLVITSVN